jgi:hypothetical protein
MGMPTEHVPAQAAGYSQPVSPVHSNTTMGMPAYEQQPQQPGAQNYAVHSNSTMMMPAGATPFPTPTAPNPQGMVDYRVANVVGANMVGPNNSQINQTQEKSDAEEEEINILAVVIFGSLSVTALGGLGMLILLMFAT